MIPDWCTWDHAKDIVQGIGYLAVVWYTHRRTSVRLDRQDEELKEQTHELKKQSVGLEWNNEVTETMASTTVPRAPALPSPIPPRPKVATLTDPFEAVMAEAEAKREPSTRP